VNPARESVRCLWLSLDSKGCQPRRYRFRF